MHTHGDIFGKCALQFAQMQGLRVLGISSSGEKLERAKDMGLSAGLNYNEDPDWDAWALKQTGGEGVDLVVEVGGTGTMARSLKAVRTSGTVAVVGVLDEAFGAMPIGPIIHKVVNVQGVYVGSRADFVAMNKAISLAELRPVGEEFHWSQARDVFVRMEEGSHFGKMVLTVG